MSSGLNMWWGEKNLKLIWEVMKLKVEGKNGKRRL